MGTQDRAGRVAGHDERQQERDAAHSHDHDDRPAEAREDEGGHQLTIRRGSSALSMASPMSVNARTVQAMASPGSSGSRGSLRMDAAPSVIMRPQVGEDAGAPAPKYESD